MDAHLFDHMNLHIQLSPSGLCSNDSTGLAPDANKAESKDFTVASEALVANAQRTSTVNGKFAYFHSCPTDGKMFS